MIFRQTQRCQSSFITGLGAFDQRLEVNFSDQVVVVGAEEIRLAESGQFIAEARAENREGTA